VKANVPAKDATIALKVPATALLVHAGRIVVYVHIGERTFRRIEVKLLDRVGDMLYLESGRVATDDRVATNGAQVLLSEEFRSDVDDD
jgi:multidrug efflux pump subunit AcrA (membrane-fusion protein)